MESAPARELIDADASALREGFIPHWGPLWVAGRHFPAGRDARDFTIYAPGRYTVEGAAARIDGELLASGRVVELTRGTHRFEPAAAVSMGEPQLRWGAHLTKTTAGQGKGSVRERVGKDG